MDRDAFVADDSWYGSYYELCLELGPTGDDERLVRAVHALWSQPQLQGPWTDRSLFGQPPSPSKVENGFVSSLWGVLSLACGQQLGCVTHAVREPEGSDWLDLCIPTGMLELVFDVQYPLEYSSNDWMRRIDQVFARIAESVFVGCPYALGIIGEEVSGVACVSEIAPNEFRDTPLFLPIGLWSSLGLNRQHRMTVPGLVSVGVPDSI